MAEEAIENELNCSICLETYTDPKILQCLHVYCQKCLVKLVIRDQQGQLSLSCPICRQVTPVPASGTSGLQSAFHINRLLEILDQQKKGKGEPASAERVDSKVESLSPCVNSAPNCSEHGGREVELFCETCGKLVCMKCVIKGGDHHSHDYKDVAESFERFREEVTPSLELIEKKMSAITKLLTQLDRQCEEITDRQAAIEAEIRDSSKRLHENIEKRENELIGQLDQITRTKLKRLATQRDQIETLQAQLSSCLKFTKKSLQTEIEQCEVLVLKTVVLKQVGEMTVEPQSDIFALSTEADVVFSASADAAAMCESYGRVYVPDSLDHLKCIAAGKGTKEARVGEKATAVLYAVSFRNLPCIEVPSFEVELVSEITRSRVECNVEPKGKGMYEYVISYLPTVKGRHRLHIKADGRHITGSPFFITVIQPEHNLLAPILTLSDLLEPWGVTITGKGEVIVTETGAHRVSVFNPSGEKLLSVGSEGSGKGQFKFPSGVAVDKEGNLFVADTNNDRIQKFTSTGYCLKGVGSVGHSYPRGIAYNSNNNQVYVVNAASHCVEVLTPDLEPISVFGKEGSGKGQFKNPRGIATDSTGQIYVVDSGNGCIQVFTADGKFLKMFGKEHLFFPVDVAVDANGLVYVTDHTCHWVTMFTPEGKFLSTFGKKGNQPGDFCRPIGVAVDDSGVVYVVDSKNGRAQIF